MQASRLHRTGSPRSRTGPAPEYCGGRGHTRVSAWRERRRLAAAQAGTASLANADNPVTMAKVTGAELLRLLRADTHCKSPSKTSVSAAAFVRHEMERS